ncbi:MAG: hypothetical protein K0B02_05475 [DPANN group archaeon]|nr:hypothetical protein [DPANN group archaeon]
MSDIADSWLYFLFILHFLESSRSNDNIFPFMLENIVASKTDAKFFYLNGFEVDFIIPEDDKLNVIEVKKNKKRFKQIKKFTVKFGDTFKTAIVVTIEEDAVVDGLHIVSVLKFLLDVL